MELTPTQLEQYENEGFLFLPGYFSRDEVARLQAELPTTFAEESPRRILEKDGKTVRSVYGSHLTNPVFNSLGVNDALVGPAMQIIGSPVYIHQFKINAKLGLQGDVWEWHQDYVFWLKEDGTLQPRMTNAVVFLDEVTEFNGPLLLIPGSHKEGVIDVPAKDEIPAEYRDNPSWISNLTADLKYSLDKPTISRLVKSTGIVAPKGPPGSLLFFHCNLCHSSSPNLSPFDRVLALITYNSVQNTPVAVERPRPDFLCGRDFSPLAISARG